MASEKVVYEARYQIGEGFEFLLCHAFYTSFVTAKLGIDTLLKDAGFDKASRDYVWNSWRLAGMDADSGLERYRADDVRHSDGKLYCCFNIIIHPVNTNSWAAF